MPLGLANHIQRCNKKCFKVLAAVLVFSLLCTYFLVRHVILCTPMPGKMIAMSDGKMLPFLDENIEGIQLSEALDVCRYEEKSGRLNCMNVKHKGETIFRQLLLSVGRMLRIIDLMSERYDFEYFLLSGALVGTFRGQKFVPWDLDGDIGMMRADYEIFRKHAKDLPLDLILQKSTEKDPDLTLAKLANHAKLRDRTTCYGICARRGCKRNDGFMVDIMVFDEVAEGVITDTFGRYRLQRREVFPIKKAMLEGFYFKVPYNSIKIIKDRYGGLELPAKWRRCQTYVGVPFNSCEEIAEMNTTYRDYLLMNTLMSNYPKLSTYFY